MPSIPLHPRPKKPSPTNEHPSANPLPTILQTPAGLAILELQGTINIPSLAEDTDDNNTNGTPPLPDGDNTVVETPIGKVMFPDYIKGAESNTTKWMKRVYLYIGRYQRMAGEVKQLTNPIAIIQKRQSSGDEMMDVEAREADGDGLEVVDIVRYKLLFKSRPEPVNDT